MQKKLFTFIIMLSKFSELVLVLFYFILFSFNDMSTTWLLMPDLCVFIITLSFYNSLYKFVSWILDYVFEFVLFFFFKLNFFLLYYISVENYFIVLHKCFSIWFYYLSFGVLIILFVMVNCWMFLISSVRMWEIFFFLF